MNPVRAWLLCAPVVAVALVIGAALVVRDRIGLAFMVDRWRHP